MHTDPQFWLWQQFQIVPSYFSNPVVQSTEFRLLSPHMYSVLTFPVVVYLAVFSLAKGNTFLYTDYCISCGVGLEVYVACMAPAPPTTLALSRATRSSTSGGSYIAVNIQRCIEVLRLTQRAQCPSV